MERHAYGIVSIRIVYSYTKLLMRYSLILIIFFCTGCAGVSQGNLEWYKNAIRYQTIGKPGDLYWEDFSSGENASLESPLKAFEILLNTQVFSHRRVGMMQYPSMQGKAFDIVMIQPRAREAFLYLIEKGYVAGQLYGLCGLYHIAISDFHKHAWNYVSSKEMVWVEYYDDTSSYMIQDVISAPGQQEGEVCLEFVE